MYYPFLRTGGTFMPEMHLKQPGFGYKACGTFTKNLCKQEIQIIFIGMIWIKLAFSMIWLMVDIKI